MPDFVAVCLSLTSLATVGLSMWLHHQTLKSVKPNEALQQMLSEVQQEKRDLLNRLMAKDLAAYSGLTHLTSSPTAPVSSGYISTSDEAEAMRVAQALAQQGLGQVIYDDDDDFRDTLGELGVTLSGRNEPE